MSLASLTELEETDDDDRQEASLGDLDDIVARRVLLVIHLVDNDIDVVA